MDDALRMGGVGRIGDLDIEGEHCLGVERLSRDAVLQRDAIRNGIAING
jgi:hypothetical protein